jgi:hypothetical protein
LVAAFAAASNLSGSRFPLVVGLLVGAGAFLIRRDMRSLLAWCGLYVGAVVVSSTALSFVSETESAVDRAGAEASGRLDAWRFGWGGLLERPIFGWGPAGFRSAVQGRFTPEFTANHARNELSQIWFDAHNIVVAVAVSFGFVGLAMVTWFVVLAARSARGPLATFALTVSLTWLLEPAALATLPLVLGCLGASMSGESRSRPALLAPPGRSEASRLLLLGGGVLASLYLLGDMRLDAALSRRDPDAVASAAAWAPWDPIVANYAAVAHANFDGSQPALREALVWMERARERQPDLPFYSNKIAQLRFLTGDREGARTAVDEALELQPWNVQSLQLAYSIADETDDVASLDDARQRLCTLGPDFCPPERAEETP